jgi:cytochrome c-type biogenesis protein CcmF
VIPELGHYALVLALALALVQATLPLWGVLRNDATLMAVAPATALAQFILVALSFAALTWAYVTSDFSLTNVVSNSHSLKPLIYRVTGVWGNHEGSMLLWVLILALFGALVAGYGRNLPDDLRAGVLAVQAWIATAFFLFMLLTSNPFARLDPAPVEGRDLNPILQDIGLAIHPPLLYVGYVGFSIAYAFAVAALITGRVDAAWARWVRPWTLLAWLFLTLGIAMGSYWAYYELGWGGWWFWDPVENASFMPWLAGTALLHSAIVMEKRNALKVWTILLAILTFSLSLLGTFLVRSGVLTSVHAFAVDPARGVVILAILCVFVGGALALYAWRAPVLKAGGLFAPISREGALLFNNLFLAAATAAVFIGTLYPLALEALTGAKISVGPPFFNMTFGPLMIPILLAMPFGPFLAWKRGDLLGVAQRLTAAVAIAFTVMAVAAWLSSDGPILAVLGIGLAVFAMAGAVSEPLSRAGFFRLPPSEAFGRLAGLPRSVWGTTFGHFGVGVTMLGIVSVSAFETERIMTMRPGQTADLAGYAVTFEGVSPRRGPNYQDVVGRFTIRYGGALVGEKESAKRLYTATGMPTTEAGIETRGFSQLYVTLGDINADGSVGVKLYHKPLVLLIWLGCVVMALGGLVSLTDRRLRVGAPARARSRRAEGKPVPAE